MQFVDCKFNLTIKLMCHIADLELQINCEMCRRRFNNLEEINNISRKRYEYKKTNPICTVSQEKK